MKDYLFVLLIVFGLSTNSHAQDNEVNTTTNSSNDRYEIGVNIKIVDGNALDALKLIPAVDVNADGIVSYRGNEGVQIFINNRPASQSGEYGPILEQILIQDIKYIDIISNPSARYDADGTSGIINIATSSNNLKNTSANVMLGFGSREKYDAGIGLQKQEGKLSLNTSYTFKEENRYTSMDANLQNFGENEPFKNTDQGYYGDNNFKKHNIQLGAQYDFNEHNNLSISTNIVKIDWLRDGDLWTEVTEEGSMPHRSEQNNVNEGNKVKGEVRLDYLHTTDREGEELAFSTAYAAGDVGIFKELGTMEQNYKDATFSNFSFQTDYTRPIGNLNLETGMKQTIRTKTEGFNVMNYDENSDDFIPDESRNNIFNYNEYVTAAYVMVSGTHNKFTYQVGARAEQTFIRTNLESNPSDIFENDYFKLYPSLNLKQGLSEYDNLFFTYTKKVERPSMRMINPFEDYSNPSYINKGNPELDASFIDSFELGYNLNKEKINFKGSLYYKLYQDPARWYTTEGENGAMVNSVENMDKASDAGVEFIVDAEIKKWWNLNANVNLFYNMIDGRSIDPNVYQTSFNWRTTVTSNMQLWKGSQLMISGTYLSPQKNPQGDVYSRYFINASLSQSVLKGQGSLVLVWDDMLDTQEYIMSRDQPTFSEYKTYGWESKVVRLTFRYRIGNSASSKKKQSNGLGSTTDAIFN
ncbi:outer membrane beta-barrel family protein [Flammeovirga sp. OC4]|uniref:outer membrane beta-barrel family protein n=1 Tax=Flammeovirga sp. OC4 TaxID=1382345 RepID=UPI0005C61D23|nr:outer membrane beta-barrel family protein [Flammeovirga sp. OC4]